MIRAVQVGLRGSGVTGKTMGNHIGGSQRGLGMGGKATAFRRGCLAQVMLLSMALLAGCATSLSPVERTLAAQRLAAAGGLVAYAVPPSPLPLQGFVRLGCRGESLHVYIEGDGLAWLTPTLPSPDPTPRNPVALRLAVRDAACNVAYLGRPGHYLGGGVAQRYWTSARFAPEVLDTYVVAIDALLSRQQSPALRLTGYSGGGAIAALVAARFAARGQSVELVTIAGNLDTEEWTRRRKLSPLQGSLNPADEAGRLVAVPQLHLSGRQDRQVPPWVLAAYLSRLPGLACVRTLELDLGHGGPWEDAWVAALQRPPACHLPPAALR